MFLIFIKGELELIINKHKLVQLHLQHKKEFYQ